jgi:hypothetical protein
MASPVAGARGVATTYPPRDRRQGSVASLDPTEDHHRLTPWAAACRHPLPANSCVGVRVRAWQIDTPAAAVLLGESAGSLPGSGATPPLVLDLALFV